LYCDVEMFADSIGSSFSSRKYFANCITNQAIYVFLPRAFDIPEVLMSR